MLFDFKYASKPTERSDSLDEAKKYIDATVSQPFHASSMFHNLLSATASTNHPVTPKFSGTTRTTR
jgi:hypothetical protein